MDLRYVKEKLLNNIASLPGGRDRRQSPIIIFPSHGEWKQFPYEDVVQVLGYLSQIPDDRSRSNGFTVIVDMRKGWIRYLKTIMRGCQQVLFGFLRQVLIIKPEQFLEKQRLFIDLALENYHFKVDLLSLHKLSRYVDFTQLPTSLGGTFPYDQARWIELRERYEQFLFEGSVTLKSLKQSKIDKLSSTSASSPEPPSSHDEAFSDDGNGFVDAPRLAEVVHKGQVLFSDLRGVQNERLGEITLRHQNPEHMLAAERVCTLLQQLKEAHDPSLDPEIKTEQERVLYEQFQLGVENLLEWLLGPGEKWLLTLHETGESKDEAKQLCKEHEQLNCKAQEMLIQVGELSEMCDKMAELGHAQTNQVKQRREQLESISGAFVARVHRQSQICQMSLHFHQLHHEFSKRMDDLLENLCTDVHATDIETTESSLRKIDAKIDAIDKSHQELLTNGANFMEQLKVQEQNSLGHEVTRDYLAGLVHVRQLLGDSQQRRKRCNDLVDVRRLKLQQLLQLFTCEKDGNQAITWIDELYEALITEYNDIGTSQEERVQMMEDQTKLENTARSTYDYGRQLSQVSLVLRRSLRADIGPQLQLTRRLESSWARFCRALSEHSSRLSISQAFYKTVQEVNDRLEDLSHKVADNMEESPESSASESKNVQYDSLKRNLDTEVRELRHMADALIERIDDEGSYSGKTSNSRYDSTTDIRKKINEIELKRQELEHVWYQPDNAQMNRLSLGPSERK